MITEILLVLLAVAVAAVIIHLFRRVVILLVNAVCGLLTLFVVNQFHLLGYFGAADIGITPAAVIVCAFGGIPGAVVLILLALAGKTI